jgi:hypothetical protein
LIHIPSSEACQTHGKAEDTTSGPDHRGERRDWVRLLPTESADDASMLSFMVEFTGRVQEELDLRHLMSLTRIFVFDAILSPSSSLERGLLAIVKDLELSVLISGVGGAVRLQPPDHGHVTINKHFVERVNGLSTYILNFFTDNQIASSSSVSEIAKSHQGHVCNC